MYRIAFTIIGGKTAWMGGINYLRNLLFALSKLNNERVYPVLLVGKKIDEKLVHKFEGLAEIRRDSLFDRFSLKWYTDMILRDLFRINPLFNKLVEQEKIDIVSHSYIYGRDLKCISINWIPDFQHCRLPKMFSKSNYLVRNYRLKALARYSDSIILSSFDALNDFDKFAPQYKSKGRVIHFVSQIPDSLPDANDIQKKYSISGKYFLLPNQFWAHKNHRVVFEAINIIKEIQPDILLVCSGKMKDDRNPKFMDSLRDFIEINTLQENIKLLGLIPYDDVLSLMKGSISVINPSFFEGWSSSVEEAKNMGKNLILSNINVHVEQASSYATFFDANNITELSNILFREWNNPSKSKETNLKENLRSNTIRFATEYESLILDFFK